MQTLKEKKGNDLFQGNFEDIFTTPILKGLIHKRLIDDFLTTNKSITKSITKSNNKSNNKSTNKNKIKQYKKTKRNKKIDIINY